VKRLVNELSMRPDNRSRILGLICQSPGIHLRELQRSLGVSFNAIRYNTEKMCHSGEITCEKSSGYSRFYPPGTSEEERLVYSLSRNKITFKILFELGNSGLLTNKELAERTCFAKSTISEHVHELLSANLVKFTLSEEGNFKVELQNREYIWSIIRNIRQADERKDVVENFVDLWDF
jgi:predicted transcriptional regulator